ncbi:MAG: FAD-dependent oxidoreductase [Alphaproteobacteria bacterium]|nr:FAD-dependent oxidoreductase [Alphaproteobacteria bacterium]
MWDVIVIGGGTAGMPTAIFAARRGAKVLVLERADELGGTLHLSSGQMSAAGTKRQAKVGIQDSADDHYDDVMRICKDTADPTLVRLAVDHAAETYDWLEQEGFVPIEGHPVLGHAHEPYRTRRYYWGPDMGRSILKTLLPLFQAEVKKGGVTLQLETTVTALVTDARGGVTGVRAKGKDGKEIVYEGKNVVLAAGGYSSNGALFKELSGHPQYCDAAWKYALGDGLNLGKSVGATWRGAEQYLCSFGAVLQTDTIPAKILARPIHHPEVRLPWEISVNAHGKRFVREDVPSVDIREHALLRQPNLRHWLVFDDAIFAAAPPVLVDHTREQIAAHFAKDHPMFKKADSLRALASAAGFDPANIEATVAAYNDAVASGFDVLGRQHKPVKIEKAPFYAIRVQGTSISSTVGLGADEQLRVTDAKGKPIPGLYAAGEVLGSAQTMGGAFVGGMMVMPALTFGRLLGQRLLQWSATARAAAE